MGEKKQVTFRIEHDLLNKLRFIALWEQRSVSAQTRVVIYDFIRQYEMQSFNSKNR